MARFSLHVSLILKEPNFCVFMWQWQHSKGESRSCKTSWSPRLRSYTGHIHCILFVKANHKASLYSIGNVSAIYMKVTAWVNRVYGIHFYDFITSAIYCVEYVSVCLAITYWALTMCQALCKICSFIYIICNSQQLWTVTVIILNLWMKRKA